MRSIIFLSYYFVAVIFQPGNVRPIIFRCRKYFSTLTAQTKWQKAMKPILGDQSLEKNMAIRKTIEEIWRTLQWRHNGNDSFSNHQLHDCLLNRLFRCRSTKTSKLRVTGLCAGNSPETGEFPAQMASNAENVSIWWRHHGMIQHTQIWAIRYSVFFIGNARG